MYLVHKGCRGRVRGAWSTRVKGDCRLGKGLVGRAGVSEKAHEGTCAIRVSEEFVGRFICPPAAKGGMVVCVMEEGAGVNEVRPRAVIKTTLAGVVRFKDIRPKPVGVI